MHMCWIGHVIESFLVRCIYILHMLCDICICVGLDMSSSHFSSDVYIYILHMLCDICICVGLDMSSSHFSSDVYIYCICYVIYAYVLDWTCHRVISRPMYIYIYCICYVIYAYVLDWTCHRVISRPMYIYIAYVM